MVRDILTTRGVLRTSRVYCDMIGGIRASCFSVAGPFLVLRVWLVASD